MFVKFEDRSARDAFVDRLIRAHPELRQDVRPSRNQPTVVTVGPDDARTVRMVREVAGPDATVYADIEFRPMAQADTTSA